MVKYNYRYENFVSAQFNSLEEAREAALSDPNICWESFSYQGRIEINGKRYNLPLELAKNKEQVQVFCELAKNNTKELLVFLSYFN